MRNLLIVLSFLFIWCVGRECEAAELYDVVRQFLAKEVVSVFDRDEPEESRNRRLDHAARAVVNVARDVTEVAALLTIGRAESNWAGYVWAGCRYPDGIPEGASDCDKGKSRSYWQMKEETCRAGWSLERGDPRAVYVFAACAAKHWRSALTRCRGRHPAGYWAGGFSGYARSSVCTWGPAAGRAKTFGMVLYKVGG